jgi:peptidoglycan/xylan/chitin deacetylase (PgdA/CDA1 family)
VLESVPVSKPVVALTMDLGETATRASTQAILDYLAAHHLRCTFFVTGWFVRTFPDLLAEIAKQGDDLGNHTDTHPHCTHVSAARLRRELTTVETLLAGQRLAIAPPKYWRPPYGEYNGEVLQTAAGLGYRTVMWSATSVDYNTTGDAHHEAARILKRTGPGGIILCHTGPVSAKVIPLVVNELLKKGYTFTTLEGLVEEGKGK